MIMRHYRPKEFEEPDQNEEATIKAQEFVRVIKECDDIDLSQNTDKIADIVLNHLYEGEKDISFDLDDGRTMRIMQTEYYEHNLSESVKADYRAGCYVSISDGPSPIPGMR